MTEIGTQIVEKIYPDDWYFSEELGEGVTSAGVQAFAAPDYESFRKEQLSNENFFKRLLLSLRDLNQARSAAIFLLEEVEWAEKYPVGELRRFQAYETSLIVAYARPFSQSKGSVPPLSYGQLGIKLRPSVQQIHVNLLQKRNKIFAHSDADIVEHSNLWAFKGSRPDGSTYSVLHPPRFKEGTYLDLYGVYRVQNIIQCLDHAVMQMLQAMHVNFPDQIEVSDWTKETAKKH